MADLLIEQVEFCDVIVLNKTDLIDTADQERLAGILRQLNPRARIVEARFGQVPLDAVLDTGLFDFDAAADAPGWLGELRGEHTPETEEYGIASFVYRARRPSIRSASLNWRSGNGRACCAQGLFLAGQPPGHAQLWSQAGAVCRHELAGQWWATTPREHWPQDEDSLRQIESHWLDGIGDARQELVLIGIAMNEAELRRQLDACLLDEAEMAAGPAAWALLPDPFPPLETLGEDAA